MQLTDGVDGVEERMGAFQGQHLEGSHRIGSWLGGDSSSETCHRPRTYMVLGTHCMGTGEDHMQISMLVRLIPRLYKSGLGMSHTVPCIQCPYKLHLYG